MGSLTTPPGASATASASASAFGGVEVNGPLGKSRTACNRCHMQKLRCVRNIGQSSCERCSRLKTTCRFGARTPRASRKPPKQVDAEGGSEGLFPVPSCVSFPNVQTNQILGDMRENDLDWIFSSNLETNVVEIPETMFSDLCYPVEEDMPWLNNLNSSMDNPFCPAGPCNFELAPLPWTDFQRPSDPLPSLPDPYLQINSPSPDNPPSIIQQIATLNVSLHTCSQKLPTLSTIPSPREPSSGKDKLFIFDELFRLTTEFISICQTHSPIPLSNSSTSLIPTTPTQNERRGSPDEATTFMLLSCHIRLHSIYTSIFSMMQACLLHSLPPRTLSTTNWQLVIPQLQIGSLSVPEVHINAPIKKGMKSEMVGLYIFMLTLVSGQLWGRVGEVMGVLAGEGEGGGKGGALATMWKETRERNEWLERTIDATRHIATRHIMQQAG